MSKLPNSWITTPLGDVLPIRYGKGLIKEVRHHGGTVPVFGSSGVLGYHNQSYTCGPAVVIGRKGNVGSVHYSGVPCWPIDTVYFAEATESTYLPFFAHQLTFLDLRHLDRSTAIPGLSIDDYCAQVAVVPPLSEQHRIVEAIESYSTRLDDAVASLERVQRNLKRYRASVLKAAVEGRLVPTEAELARAEGRDYEPASVLLERILAERRRGWEKAELAKLEVKGKVPKDDKWKAKYKEPVPADADDLPGLPEGWCWATLPQLGELNRGKSKHRPRNDPRLLGGPYPFIQTGDVRRSEGFLTDYSATYSEFGLAQSRLWPAGTVCITIAGNIANTGILKFDACFPDSVVGFRTDTEPVLSRFVEFFLRTAKAGLDRYAPATAQKNINLEVLSAVAVPLPPLAEQGRLVSEVDRLLSVGTDAEKAAAHSALRVARLRQSILKWAFEGRLVDQNPADEPAMVLLERIKSEREAKPAPCSRSQRSASRTSKVRK